MYRYTFRSLSLGVYICTSANIYIYIYMYIYTCISMYIYTCSHSYLYKTTLIHTHIYVHVYIEPSLHACSRNTDPDLGISKFTP